MNKCIFIGNLTKDYEVRHFQDGSMVANNALAINRKFKNAQGSVVQETSFIDLVFYRKLAEIANQYTHKGSKIAVECRLKQENWTDKQTGANRSKLTFIVESMEMLDTKPQSNQQGNNQPQSKQQSNQQSKYEPQDTSYVDDSDDVLPF